MKVSDLVKLTNEKLDGERFTEAQLINHMDSVIFDINEALSAVYPTFSEAKQLPGYDGTYTLLPDMYLRNLVPVGAALKYYQAEEEGEGVARTYQETYGMYLFVIKRDYIEQVPEIFRALGRGVLDVSKWNKSVYGYTPVTDVFPVISSTEFTILKNRVAVLEAKVAALEAE